MNQPANDYENRETWVKTVRGAMDRGKLEKIPTRIAKTPREKDKARKQNYYLTKRVYGGFGDNYDNIQW